MRSNRHWMYTRINNNSTINKDFVNGVENCITFAYNQLGMMTVTKIRSLCRKCKNRKFHTLVYSPLFKVEIKVFFIS